MTVVMQSDRAHLDLQCIGIIPVLLSLAIIPLTLRLLCHCREAAAVVKLPEKVGLYHLVH